MDTALIGILALLLAGLAVRLWLRARNAAQVRADARAHYFDAAEVTLSDVSRGLAPDGFARLNGRHGGRLFDLQVVPDTLTFRKLPALWLLVSLPEPMPVRATFDMMIRPSGGEPFSNFRELRHSVEPPDGFPPGAAIRTDAPPDLPPGDMIARHLGPFADPAVKELVISPRGLRLVRLAEEAERTRYLLFRDAEMGREPLPAATLTPLLAALGALADDLAAASRVGEAAAHD